MNSRCQTAHRLFIFIPMQISELYAIYRQYPKVNTDTRKDLTRSIFFCLKGPNFDANAFADKALQNGAVHVVTDAAENKGKENMTFVDDALKTLQDLATYHRKNLHIPFIGLTGSNGKTTNKELIAAVLATTYETAFTKGNLNNHIGVPLTLLEIPNSAQMAVIEMGANHQKEIAGLCKISDPDFGLITNIGKAHLEGFGGIEGVKKGKKELFDYLENKKGKAFVNGDDPIITELAKNLTQIRYGKNKDGFVNGEIKQSLPFISFTYTHKNYSSPVIHTRLVGDYNFYNLMAAVCIGIYFEVSYNNINQALKAYIPSNNRSQFIRTSANEVIMDAYNANPSSMDAALENLNRQPGKLKYALLGEMLELGKDSAAEHQGIIDKLKELEINSLLVGKSYAMCDTKGFIHFDTSSELKEYLKTHPIKNALILLKGSRAVAMENVLETL